MTDKQDHWNAVYGARTESALTWFEESPAVSREMMVQAGITPGARVLDAGGGASRLVDTLLDDGFTDLTVLDLSAEALKVSQDRLGARAKAVQWIAADITDWQPEGPYDLWHDRAVFHFLTEAADRAAYIRTLTQALRPGGVAIIGTFALDGPEKCSNLPVIRYCADGLAQELGAGFARITCRAHTHQTPMQRTQSFTFCTFRRR
ncbi:class I SAM-dependent methyltransferase [Pararhodobacter sp.]|uniref:class I SAM-dependent methyltransferase n=1 Tax=Pararhodobacter sp. TaxID=2127056 RepID=UPI002AFE832D|nr:class I SAM-dependent methyltransferase [Pararhodobacter sp.]